MLKRIFRLISLKYIRLKRKFNSGLKFTAKDGEYKSYDIGEYTYGLPTIINYGNGANLKIGKFCAIADNVKIMLDGEHKLDDVSIYPFQTLLKLTDKTYSYTKGDVIIGNDVWIGHGATILSGVNIGDGAVIGANAIVRKSVEPYSIVVGNPGKVIRKRFSQEIIDKLLKIKWWDWHILKITASEHEMYDIDKFVEKYG
jgi:acetyltransferase-like isoleucine patch superfamily enzyme